MQTIQYGNLPFSIVQTLSQSATPIQSDDGLDYLFSKISIEAVVTFNPQANSFAKGNVIGGFYSTPTAQTGIYGATSVANIRHYLAQPRLPLTITNSNGDVWLQSPKVDGNGIPYPSDCKGGPFCEMIGPPKIHSDRTWELRLRFTTYIRECGPDSQSDRYALSNRFSQTMDITPEGFTTITTQGRVVFDLSTLLENPTFSQDSLRRLFFFPVPTGFQRQIRTGLSSDGTTVDYVTVDTQESHGYMNSMGVQRIEIVTSRGWEQVGDVDANLHALINSMDSLTNNTILTAASIINASTSPAGTLSSSAAAVVQFGAMAAASGASVIFHKKVEQIPKLSAMVNVKCFGSPGATRANVSSVAIAVAFAKLSTLVGSLGSWTAAFRLTERHTSSVWSEVTLQGTISLPQLFTNNSTARTLPAQTANALLTSSLDNVKFAWNLLLNMIPDGENITAKTPAGNVVIDQGTALPPPPGDGISRGTYATYLVYQALKAGCAAVPSLNTAVSKTLP